MIFTTIPTSSLAADYSRVGVRAGDAAEYLYTYANPGGPVNVTGRLLLQFVNVTGTIVRINESWNSFSDSYNQTEVFDFNVSSGHMVEKLSSGDLPTVVSPYLMTVGLDVGDPVYELGGRMTVMEIILMKVTRATRWVNHYHYASSWMESSHLEDYYWDRETGLLVQMTIKWNYTLEPSSAGMENVTLIFASVLAPTSSELFLASGGVAAVVVTLVAAFGMSGRRRADR